MLDSDQKVNLNKGLFMCWAIMKYRFVTLSFTALLIISILMTCSVNDEDLNKIFKSIETIDYSNVEAPVVVKISELLETTKANPDSLKYWGMLGMNLFIHGYKKESVPVFKKAAFMDQSDFRWPYFCALALNDLNSDEATEWFEKSINLKPSYPPLCVKYGNRSLISGDLQKAKTLFNDAVSTFKNVPHAYVGLAKVAISENNIDTAYSYLTKALQLAPNYREPHVLLADVYRRQGEKTKAEGEFKIIEKLPRKLDLKDPVYNQMVDEGVSSFWHQVRGDSYLQTGQLTKAEMEFKKVIEIKPHASFNVNLGNVYQKQKKYELAIEQYQAALKLDSVNIDALNNLGVIFFKTDRTDKAISLVKRSLSLNPDSKDGYLNLGTFYKQLKRRSESIQYFQKGMALDPDDLRFAYQLSWLYSSSPDRKDRNGKEALRLSKLIFDSKDIDTFSKYDLVAAALAENNQFARAVDMAGQAQQMALKKGQRKLASDILKRVNLYKNKKPFRESD